MKPFIKKLLNLKLNVIILIFIGTAIIYGVYKQNGLWIFQTGDSVSSSKMNENFQYLLNKINTLEAEVNSLKQAVPQNTVAAFNLEQCPESWVPADGDTYDSITTPDLRGRFIRGMTRIKRFEDGSYKSPTVDDRDGDGVRSLRSYQTDAVGKHRHLSPVQFAYEASLVNDGYFGNPQNYKLASLNKSYVAGRSNEGIYDEYNIYTYYYINNDLKVDDVESRVKNVTLTFCIKR